MGCGGWVGDQIWNSGGSEVKKAVDDTVHFAEDVIEITIDVIKVGVEFAIETIKDPMATLRDPQKVISFAAALFLAPETGGASLYYWGAYYAVQSGMLTQLAVSMTEKGWINEAHTAVVSTIFNVAGMIVMGANSGYIQGSSGVNTIQALEAIGVSQSTALQIGLLVQSIEYSVFTAYAIKAYNLGSSLYSAWQSYMESINLEKAYKEAMAAFEAWKKSFLEKQQIEDDFISSFVSGNAMKYYPGQRMFAITNPSREYYMPMQASEPGIVMVGGKLMQSDIDVAKYSFNNPYFQMAGSGSFIDILSEYPKFWRVTL